MFHFGGCISVFRDCEVGSWPIDKRPRVSYWSSAVILQASRNPQDLDYGGWVCSADLSHVDQ